MNANKENISKFFEKELSWEKEEIVREDFEFLVSTPETSGGVLSEILKKTDQIATKMKIAKHKNTKQEDLEILFEEKIPVLPLLVLGNANTPEHIFLRGAEVDDFLYQTAIIMNESSPIEALQKIVKKLSSHQDEESKFLKVRAENAITLKRRKQGIKKDTKNKIQKTIG